jgi:hypothetical protein
VKIKKYFGKFILFSVVLPLFAHGESFTVKSDQASVYEGPQKSAKVLGHVGRGKKVVTEGNEDGGFLRIKTKSGRAMWVHTGDLLIEDVSGDFENDSQEPQKIKYDFPKFTWDLGFSTGSYSGKSYSEAQLGLNTFFMDWLAWRNAVFYRFAEVKNVYGLDTSARLYFRPDLGVLGFTVFGGPGFRFVSEGKNSPFGEAGLILRIGGFQIGGGAKVLFYSAVDSQLQNDTSYFILLSGGGSL